jgi:hypothetical protein
MRANVKRAGAGGKISLALFETSRINKFQLLWNRRLSDRLSDPQYGNFTL